MDWDFHSGVADFGVCSFNHGYEVVALKYAIGVSKVESTEIILANLT